MISFLKKNRSPTKVAVEISDRKAEVKGEELVNRSNAVTASVAVVENSPEKEPKPTNLDLFGEDSDESDDEAALNRYDKVEVKKNDEGTAPEEYNKRNVALLLSKLSPEELFTKFDEDKSGLISIEEFTKMLPELNINVNEAKARRIFRACDKDNSGEIDLEEFKMALFAVDPHSGNTLQFTPSTLLSPKDAFALFDEDNDGQINELEFADVLEYFGIQASDAKQEKLFKKYDKDRSGAMWLQCVDVEQELRMRKIEIPKYSTRSKLTQILELVLLEEEHNENQVLIEAKWYHAWQLEKIRRTQLASKAFLRAQDELAAALDAAGQVYVLGSGQYDQFTGTPAVRDPLLYDGYKTISTIWEARVKPTYEPLKLKLKPADAQPNEPEPLIVEKVMKKSTSAPILDPNRIPFVRRRPENLEWNNISPPKLDRLLWKPRRKKENPKPEGAPPAAENTIENEADDSTKLLGQFLEDRQYIRSLRFKEIHPMTNTGWLWGRQVVQATITDSIAYAITATGQVYCWGGQNKWWKGLAIEQNELESEEDDDEDLALQRQHKSEVEKSRQLTARSELQKMAAPKYVAAAVNLEVEMHLQNVAELKYREEQEIKQYEKYKRVVMYFDLWEPPPSTSTRVLFLHQVLLPKITVSEIQSSLRNRGFPVERATKLEMIDLFGDCLDIEQELCSEELRRSFREMDFQIKQLEAGQLKPKQSAQLAADKLKFEADYAIYRQQQKRLHELKIEEVKQSNLDFAICRENAFEASVAHHRIQLEDVCPEHTPRNTSLVLELNGITSRGPPLHPQRGAAAAWRIAAGESYACVVTHQGALYTWGVGIHGRLGHGKSLEGIVNADADHPTRVKTLHSTFIKEIACAFDHSAALSVDGQVFVWGSAATGKLGIGPLDDKYEQYALYPMLLKMPNHRRIRQVACGRAHTGAVSTQGELFMWGCANGGRLGLGDFVQDQVSVPTYVKCLSHVRVIQVSCGNTHSAICTEIHSEINASIETISGGEIYMCG
ncbi:hypothetical protein THRCLA_04258, partial [Thraustotheca clavata]